ncbi:hypothetical protein TrST_g10569 [Triparma strigata]|uniref:Uncharacterized protein n=1 Tax=Triparma strigata TaxID=1606541 RepID=A0A9W7AT69_9STRA|nr:hypothetical protein TrST_g10569 [Triparma strigata]
MSKRTSEDLSSAIEILDPNSLESGDDDTEVFEGSELDSAADVIPAGGGDDFMHTDDFRRLFVGFAMVETLVVIRWLDRKWHKVVEKKLIELENEPFGEIIVHGGNDISGEAYSDGTEEMMKLVTKVVFLLNIMKVGDRACLFASILVTVDIPEGITFIGTDSFFGCSSLKDIKFPKSLKSIGYGSFINCYSLEEVDLLHTFIQELGGEAFFDCTSLREMKIPDSLQTFGNNVFLNCSKLVPSHIDVSYYDSDEEYDEERVDVTSEVIAHLRSLQS